MPTSLSDPANNVASNGHLCVADEASFWPWFRWPDFAAWPGKSETVVVLPIVGFADWGLGHALDIEETLAMPVLRQAAELLGKAKPGRLLVLPEVVPAGWTG